ncbi:MAG: 2Fe-2S iron-sulfur cluster-binding protein, partial [Haloferacaceae archaeon]
MSADDPLPGVPGTDGGDAADPLPAVADLDDPRHETPVTAEFETGTANDPEVGTDGPTTVTVDGERVTVPAGSTVIDALRAVDDDVVRVDPGADGVADDADVPALCYYDRESDCGDAIGPRSECRTCMVETEAHGLVPSCSFPAEDGLSVRTDAPDAAEARSVNLDLVLSNHNLRCTTCNGNGRCELQDAAVSEGVDHPRYGVFDDRDAYEPVDDSSSFIQIDRNKCILCNRCV